MAEMRVLVVDDHEDNLILLKMVLEARGIAYLGATDGAAGVRLAKSERPDLILMDLEMPGMDGFQALAALKADRSTAGIPVIILTATFMEPASVERGLSLGADEYLVKPINQEELLVRVRSVVRARRAERELSQLRKDFQSMLVHDLRSPLEGVGIALDMLVQHEVPKEQADQVIALARDQVRSLSELVGGLLELHRAEAGTALTMAALDAGELCRTVVAESELVARDRHLDLVCSAPDSLPMWGDRRLLKRVLTNLVSNALKFTTQGAVTLRARAEGPDVRFDVSDTGPGIPPADAARIFDKYFHIARRRERPEHGFGLGLAFCKAAIEEHGGAIGVTSVPGEGATFWIRLPAGVASQVEPLSAGLA